MTRREAREQAFTLIFEKEFHPELTPEELLADVAEERGVKKEGYTKDLFFGVEEKKTELDEWISGHSTAWKVNRISKVALSTLRLCVYEMRFVDTVSYAVAINEAVELAKKYEGKEGAAFVNGVLGGIAKRYPEAETKTDAATEK